jgi:hypothetical protein
VIVLDSDPLQDIGCSQIQPRTWRWSSRPVPSAALTRGPVQLPPIVGNTSDHLRDQTEKASEDHPHITGSRTAW